MTGFLRMPVKLIAEASLKNFYLRFQWWPTVLLEWEKTWQTVVQTQQIFLQCFFSNFPFFPVTFLPVPREKIILTQITYCR